MKVVFITMNPFSKFVTYKRAVGTGEWLSRMGHDIYIIAEDCEENRLRATKEAPSCKMLWYQPGSRIREIATKLRHVRHVRPDFVYTSVFSVRNLSGLGWLLPKGTKVILEFCELYSSIEGHKVLWRLLEWFAVRSNDMFLCASKYLELYFREYMEKHGILKQTIYAPYAYPEYMKTSIRHNSADHIVFMASLWRAYGVFEVLEAFKCVRNSRNGVKLDILGKGPAYDEVKQWIYNNGLNEDVVLHGYVKEDDLPDVFSQGSVFVAPMHDTIQDRARCPSKLYYYIPYGKPIVTCKIGDPYDTLGNCGYYYEPGSVLDMARAMLKALEDSDTFSYPEGFVENHSWKARAAQFESWVAEQT